LLPLFIRFLPAKKKRLGKICWRSCLAGLYQQIKSQPNFIVVVRVVVGSISPSEKKFSLHSLLSGAQALPAEKTSLGRMCCRCRTIPFSEKVMIEFVIGVGRCSFHNKKPRSDLLLSGLLSGLLVMFSGLSLSLAGSSSSPPPHPPEKVSTEFVAIQWRGGKTKNRTRRFRLSAETKERQTRESVAHFAHSKVIYRVVRKRERETGFHSRKAVGVSGKIGPRSKERPVVFG